MMKKLIMVMAFLLTGCTASYVERVVDPVTGVLTEVKYSKYYEAAKENFFADVDIMAYAEIKDRTIINEQRNKNMSPEHLMDDIFLRVYFSNPTENRYHFNVQAMSYETNNKNGIILNNTREVSLVPNSIERIDAFQENIEQRTKSIKVDVFYQVGDKAQVKKTIILRRLTAEEAKKHSRFPFNL